MQTKSETAKQSINKRGKANERQLDAILRQKVRCCYRLFALMVTEMGKTYSIERNLSKSHLDSMAGWFCCHRCRKKMEEKGQNKVSVLQAKDCLSMFEILFLINILKTNNRAQLFMVITFEGTKAQVDISTSEF